MVIVAIFIELILYANVADLYSNDWCDNSEVTKSDPSEGINGESQAWVPLKTSSSSATTKVYHHGGKSETISAPVILLPHVDTLPPSSMWTQIDRNIRIIPCCSDNDSDEDEDENIQRAKMESAQVSAPTSKELASFTVEDLKDDQVFIALVGTLMEYEYKCPPSGAQVRESEVFNAIHEACPEAGFPYLLKERFVTFENLRGRDEHFMTLMNFVVLGIAN